MIPLRDENPSKGFPIVTILLIALNSLVFFYEVSLGEQIEGFVFRFGLLPVEITTGHALYASDTVPPLLNFVTSMFLHGGFMHLIGNMWFLWIFGDNIEDFLGKFMYFFFYLLTGIAAGLVHVFFNPASQIPTVGASGAISGVLGAYMVLHPRIRIKTLVSWGFYIDFIYVPAVLFLGIWFALQLLGGLNPMSPVAYGAHIGGFAAGALFILLFTRRDRHYHERYEAKRLRRW